VLKRNGIEPAPERSKRTTWSTFLRAHGKVLAASDFFTVEVWTPKGLLTHYVLFAISLAERAVHIAGISTRPDGAWMLQVCRNLIDEERRGPWRIWKAGGIRNARWVNGESHIHPAEQM
jgi:hypothetical protein